MKYALNLAEDKRVLSACVVLSTGKYDDMPIVDTLPDGDIYEYKYKNRKFVHDPLPAEEEPTPEPTTDEVLNALLGV